MRNHLSYLKYVIKHKAYVLWAACSLDVPWYRALFHDASKFLPSEWFAYTKTFYNADGTKKEVQRTDAFDKAWLKHQRRNKHHWQYWVLIRDSGYLYPFPMPETYVREMLADWIGAGLAITGKLEVCEWWNKNKKTMVLHAHTRERIEALLSKI